MLREKSHKAISYHRGGDLSKVNQLVERGAELNAKRDGYATILMHASIDDQRELVQALLNKGTDVNAKTKDGCNVRRSP